MPLDADAVRARLPRRRARRPRISSAAPRLERFRSRRDGGAPLTVGCTQEAPLFAEVAGEAGRRRSPSPMCARPPAGRARRARPGRRWRRCSPPPPSRCRRSRSSASTSEGVILIYGRDERAIEAAALLKDHLDVTVLLTRARRCRAAARDRFPGRQGHDPRRQGTSRRLRAHGRRLRRSRRRPRARRLPSAPRATARCRAATSSSTSPAARRCSPAADLRDGYLRADPGDPAAVLRAVLKRARPRRHVRQAALCRPSPSDLCAHSRSQHRRLPPLPRSLPDRRHRAGRRSCRDRRADLRRLRPVRRRLSDRRRGLCAAAGRCAHAQAAHAARDLPRGRRRAAGRCSCMTTRMATPLIDALARHGDGLPANVLPRRGQRGHAGRARSDRGGLRLWRRGAALSCCARSRATTSPALRRRSRWPSRSSPASASAAARVGDDRDRRSRSRSARRCARIAPASRRRGPRRFPPVGGKRDVLRLAAARAASRGARAGRCRARCRPARRSARSSSMSKAARSASPACPPARPARCSTIPSARCCASPRTPACSAACARRPARRR